MYVVQPQGPPVASWGLLGPSGASWGLLGLPGASSGLLGFPGASWSLLGPPEAFRDVLGRPGVKLGYRTISKISSELRSHTFAAEPFQGSLSSLRAVLSSDL